MVTSARRSGMEYITPSMPPSAQTAKEARKGKWVHQPIMIRPGRTKIMDDSVPAADAMVWTMLFSWIVASANSFRKAIEKMVAGIEEEKVRPALRPK